MLAWKILGCKLSSNPKPVRFSLKIWSSQVDSRGFCIRVRVDTQEKLLKSQLPGFCQVGVLLVYTVGLPAVDTDNSA